MSAFFIKHPAIAAVIAIVTTLLGLVCMFNLPISQYPEITPRTIQLQAMFPGASAQAVADSVGTPIILYNVPSRTGVNIQPETYAELAQHPNIAGVKEASGNFSQIQKTRNLCPADFAIWSGNDDETAAICMLGGSGVISVVANVLPAEMHRLTALCLANDFSAAGRLQLKLKPLCDALFCEVNPIPVKTALNLMGLEAGELRLPLCPPTDASVERLKLALSSWDLLPEQTS